jgi:hypothetical protein
LWFTNGNPGTSPGANFLGTTDAQPLVIRTNNVEALRVTAGGNVGIGITNPLARLDVGGTINARGGLAEDGVGLSKKYALVDGSNAIGTWPIGITGNAGTVTNGVYTTGDQTIGGNKTFSNPIVGSVTGSAAGFTGSLGGDVTGTQGSTTVSKLQGVPLSGAAPSAGQVLTFNGTSWAPAAASAGPSAAPPVLCPGCYLIRAQLIGANLVDAYLGTDRAGNGVDLGSAKLTNANLTNAVLTGASLRFADLTNANLTGAYLQGADLTGATGGTSATVTNVLWAETVCPDGTNSDNDRNTCVGHGF